MGNVQSLSHSKWKYIYHITWIPKYRKKIIYKEFRKYLGEVFKELAETLHPHPTLSEILFEVALKALDRSLHG